MTTPIRPQALTPSQVPVTVDADKCIAHKGCTVCVDVCPLDVLAIDLSKGTAYLVQKSTYTVSDPEAFREWVKTTPGAIALFSNSLAKESVEEFIASSNTLPPGVKVSSVQSLRVNKPTTK